MDDERREKMVKHVLIGALTVVLTALFWVPEISELAIDAWLKIGETWERLTTRVWRSAWARESSLLRVTV